MALRPPLFLENQGRPLILLIPCGVGHGSLMIGDIGYELLTHTRKQHSETLISSAGEIVSIRRDRVAPCRCLESASLQLREPALAPRQAGLEVTFVWGGYQKIV